MGLDRDRMDTAAKDLSGGEKARLLLGIIAFDGPHLLILDEPTNHLDMQAREALMLALNDYSGAVIIISHDRSLVEASVDRLWLVRDGTVKPYEGDIEEYRTEVLTGRPPKSKKVTIETEPEKKTGAERRKDAAVKRKEYEPLARRIKDAEDAMAKLQRMIERIDAELASPGLYEKDPGRVAKLAKDRSDLEAKLVRAEEGWLALSQEYEAAIAS